ncbi:ribonuclease T1 [Nocardioides ginsengisegetis]|uniref:Ribonuclease T1 n=1 Tax=Nocardioides ginsengisegetis TaxID=661491 RepID=A0A7W3J0M4_9ACTN|nr:ribonuclease domain-containing protein [Nocardioides ginsengisegetis]MBA8803934.1 ribonuclease T1 [Nocardioides ginsengisegetis]
MRSDERGRTTGAAALGLALLLAVGIWLVSGRDPGTSTATSPDPTPSAGATSDPGTDPASGLPYVAAADLPPEARDVLRRIDAGGPFAYDEDGGTFGNFEGLLPDHDGGYYAEYTVDTPGSDDRGARRIVAGDGGELYWTADHYASFARIRR